MSTPLLCPSCLEPDHLATIEELRGTASLLVSRNDDGSLGESYSGTTDVDWDSSTTVGVECECGFSYRGTDWAAQLIPAPTLAQLVTIALQPDRPTTPTDVIRAAADVPDAKDGLVRLLVEILRSELGDRPLVEDIFDVVDEHRSTLEEGVLAPRR